MTYRSIGDSDIYILVYISLARRITKTPSEITHRPHIWKHEKACSDYFCFTTYSLSRITCTPISSIIKPYATCSLYQINYYTVTLFVFRRNFRLPSHFIPSRVLYSKLLSRVMWIWSMLVTLHGLSKFGHSGLLLIHIYFSLWEFLISALEHPSFTRSDNIISNLFN